MSASSTGTPAPRRARLKPHFGFILHPVFQRGLLALVVSSLVSFLMIDYVRLPSEELKVGDIAEANVRANQSLEFTDADATRQRRDQAEHAVRPLFELDVAAAKTVTNRVHKAFSLVRTHLNVASPAEPPAEAPAGGKAPGAAPTSDARATGGRALEALPGSGAGKAARDAAVLAAGAPPPRTDSVVPLELSTPEVRREFFDALGADMLDVFYQNLVFLRFDPALENAICAVLESTMKSPIIADKSVLPDDMASAGITVLRASEGSRDEKPLFSAEQVLDLSDARRRTGQLTADLFSDRPQFHRDTIAAFASRLILPTMSYNAAQTAVRRQQARDSTQAVTYQVKKGTMIVRAGDPIDSQKYMFLHGIAQAKADYHAGRMFASVVLLIFLMLTATYAFAANYIRKFSTSIRDLVTASIILVFVVALTRVGVEVSTALAAHIPTIPLSSYYFAIPVACGAMVVRLLMNSETALVFAVVTSACAAMLLDYNLFHLAYFFVSSIAAAGGMAHTKERVHVLRGGLVSAAVNILAVLAINFVQSSMMDARFGGESGSLPTDMVFALVGGIGAAILALGVLPFFEMFGYVTDHKLLELANLNHPLLKDLMVLAPGTYHHSVIVGTLSEAAAQAIKANALLARVGCYYHDIGKMRKPEYFIENLRDLNENRHDRLPPHMSALIIASHVRDGIEMGRQHRLPEPIIDLIPQHHGTALISFFYNKARQNATDTEVVDENDFRYPGPKPQTREAGIVMLADATEASTRSIKQVTSAKIRMNLQKIFQRVISDGQLDECPLTLKDLAVIGETFHRTLLGIYHSRIEYPPEFRGAQVAGEGTGAVITLDGDRVTGARAGGATPPGRMRPEELAATTTAESLPLPAPPGTRPPPSYAGARSTGNEPTLELPVTPRPPAAASPGVIDAFDPPARPSARSAVAPSEVTLELTAEQLPDGGKARAEGAPPLPKSEGAARGQDVAGASAQEVSPGEESRAHSDEVPVSS